MHAKRMIFTGTSHILEYGDELDKCIYVHESWYCMSPSPGMPTLCESSLMRLRRFEPSQPHRARMKVWPMTSFFEGDEKGSKTGHCSSGRIQDMRNLSQM
jgi:hypothetical protein